VWRYNFRSLRLRIYEYCTWPNFTEVDARYLHEASIKSHKLMLYTRGALKERILINLAYLVRVFVPLTNLERRYLLQPFDLCVGFPSPSSALKLERFDITLCGRTVDWYKQNKEAVMHLLKIRVRSLLRYITSTKQHVTKTVVMGASFRNR